MTTCTPEERLNARKYLAALAFDCIADCYLAIGEPFTLDDAIDLVAATIEHTLLDGEHSPRTRLTAEIAILDAATDWLKNARRSPDYGTLRFVWMADSGASVLAVQPNFRDSRSRVALAAALSSPAPTFQ